MESTVTEVFIPLTHNQGVLGSSPSGPTAGNTACPSKDGLVPKVGREIKRASKTIKRDKNRQNSTNKNELGISQQ